MSILVTLHSHRTKRRITHTSFHFIRSHQRFNRRNLVQNSDIVSGVGGPRARSDPFFEIHLRHQRIINTRSSSSLAEVAAPSSFPLLPLDSNKPRLLLVYTIRRLSVTDDLIPATIPMTKCLESGLPFLRFLAGLLLFYVYRTLNLRVSWHASFPSRRLSYSFPVDPPSFRRSIQNSAEKFGTARSTIFGQNPP
jgi:hypothetical protein